MSAKFQNKFRNGSIRLQHWDYGRDAAYFITICSRDRENFFGKIQDGKMNLSGTGIVADVLWHEIPNHAKNVELGEYVVMPNHIHGIIILSGNKQPWTTDNINVDDVGSRHALTYTYRYLKKQQVKSVSKIRGKIPFHPLWVHTNRP